MTEPKAAGYGLIERIKSRVAPPNDGCANVSLRFGEVRRLIARIDSDRTKIAELTEQNQNNILCYTQQVSDLEAEIERLRGTCKKAAAIWERECQRLSAPILNERDRYNPPNRIVATIKTLKTAALSGQEGK